MRRVLYLSGLYLATLGQTNGQFYAPATEYHDPVQRVFVVEVARVLAWQENQAGANWREVSWKVENDTNQTRWQLTWHSMNNSTTRTASVRYGADSLRQGPGFYRDTFRQVAAKRLPGASAILTEASAQQAFWEGATDAKPSREGSLARAFEVQNELANHPGTVARLAGLLSHAALPGVVGRLTIDSVLSARAAAWLVTTEQNCQKEMDAAWVPILFAAGREASARSLRAKLNGGDAPASQKAIELWQLWLQNPPSRDIYLKATESPHWGLVMPMLAYDTLVSGNGKLLAEMIQPLAGSQQQLGEFHNFGPLFALRTGVGGGHIMNGAWPVYQRRAWLEVLRNMPAAANDLTAHKQEAESAIKGNPRREAREASLTGFTLVVPLLRMGHSNGVGPLLPVAVATVRDVLNYGWESAGQQMGSRYRFVNRNWGIPEQAKPIMQTVTSEVEGLIPFFMNQEQAKTLNYMDSLLRLQLVDGFYDLVGWNPTPFTKETKQPEAAALLHRRSWLRPRDFEWQARNLWDANLLPKLMDSVKALQDEGGPMAAAEMLQYFTSIDVEHRTNFSNIEATMVTLSEKLPQPTSLYISAQYQTRFAKQEPVAMAKDMEKLYWQNPDGGFEDNVFNSYLYAGAYASARRFYRQSRANSLNPVAISHGRGRAAFVMGYVFDDPELRRMAMEDSSSGSSSDMLMHIWDAAIRDNTDDLQEHTQELVDRYETSSGANTRGKRLMKFLALLPALKDPKHPSRREALSYFGKEAQWIVLRWIWIEKFKIPSNDAITFLGGRENDPLRRALICYLEGNLSGVQEALKEYGWGTRHPVDTLFLAHYLAHKLAKEPEKPDQDLRPTNAKTTRDLLAAKLKLEGN